MESENSAINYLSSVLGADYKVESEQIIEKHEQLLVKHEQMRKEFKAEIKYLKHELEKSEQERGETLK